ncbi:MAG: hypothetical protein ACRDOE_25285 [Streptosporangiaceae bacterium]
MARASASSGGTVRELLPEQFGVQLDRPAAIDGPDHGVTVDVQQPGHLGQVTGHPDGGAATQSLREVLTAHPGISWVQLPQAGVEKVAEAGVIDRQRQWTSAKGAYAEPVAEHALVAAPPGRSATTGCLRP